MGEVDAVLTLVFTIVMLLFMVFPAIKIVAGIERYIAVPARWHNPLLFAVVIALSLAIGLFLRFF